MPQRSEPTLCTVIATRKRPADIAEQVQRVLAQTSGNERVIVVVDGDPETKLKPHPRLMVRHMGQCGVNVARRIGTSMVAAHEIVVEVDDHDLIRDGAMRVIRDAFRDPSVSFVYGDCVVRDPAGLVMNVERGKKDDYSPSIFGKRCEAWGLAAYRHWLYTAAGGWPIDEGTAPGGDMILYMRMEAVLSELPNPGIVHLPVVLNDVIMVADPAKSISAGSEAEQRQNALTARMAIQTGSWQPAATPIIVPTAASPDPLVAARKEAPVVRLKLHAERRKPMALICHTKWGATRKSGGGELSSAHWKPALVKAGFQVHVRVTDEIDGEPGANVKLCSLEEIVNEIRELRPNVVIARDGFQGTAARWKFGSGREIAKYGGLVGVCRELGIPVILRLQFWRGLVDCFHSNVWDVLNDPEHSEIETVRDVPGTSELWRAHGIIVNSEFCATAANDMLLTDRAVVEHPRIPLTPILPGKELDHVIRSKILLPAGQFGKGLKLFVELARRFANYTFRVLALHPKEEAWIKGQKLPDNLEIGGRVDDMRPEYAAARVVFIATETAETFCRAAAEARANGIMLLVSDAGNLPTFLTKPAIDLLDNDDEGDNGTRVPDVHAGIVVSRNADIEGWAIALRAILDDDQPSTDRSWCDGEVDVLPAMAKGLTAGWHTLVVYPETAPGVTNGVKHLCAVTGAHAVGAGELSGYDIAEWRSIILCGGMSPSYREIIRIAPGSVALNWRSHCLQMSYDPHELNQLAEAVELSQSQARLAVCASYRDSAIAWRKVFGLNTRWLPDCYDLGSLPAPWQMPRPTSDFSMLILGPSGPRKNIATVFMAAKLAGIHVMASNWLQRDKPLMAFVDSLGLKVQWLNLRTEHEVMEAQAATHVHVTASVGETFGYTAASAMLMGVPVIGNDLVPVCRYEDPSMRDRLLASPTSAVRIAEQLTALQSAGDFVELGAKCRDHMLALVTEYNAQAQRTIQELHDDTR